MPRPDQSSQTHTSPTQAAKLLAYLKDHPEGITDLQALMFLGIRRLAARIFELTQQGITFAREWVHLESGAKVIRYSIAVPVQSELQLS